MKRRWLVITLLVGVMAIGITGGTVLAQDGGGVVGGDSPPQKFTSRVATILGLDEAHVQAAFKQAGREMQNEALQRKLARMVEHGRLTQEQADAYMEWYQARPEGLLPGFGGHGFHRGGMMGGRGGHGMMGPWEQMPPPPAPGSSTTTTGL
jgi:hypothetical protein